MNNLDYPESITVTLSPKYNKLVRDFCELTNTPLNQFIKHAVVYYWEKIQSDTDYLLNLNKNNIK